ncbi:DUF2637 domain-containing protein [Streptomyces sp. WMMB 322]|uniref:DUF2637 domain-containing protein n=1 Tax=Streptomyces sp. WMMB 322 TaxID=1286821 RepID=UPI0006E207E8|nr:DUF2637 domain-containing protein [Streptomyces sp. WMMB 322]
MTRTHRILAAVVVIGAVTIAAIGFAGSFAAVRDLAERKGFGAFAPFFPIGIDAGIVVLLALDLLLTWIRIPFPLLRQTAWLLTAATIAFNGAAAWPDPLGVGMHAVIPVLFVVSVEAARHAIGRIADITADKHMEGVRVSRWLLAFPSTFRLWRRMKLWELRSYDEVIRMEQERLVYEARLRARYGRNWRRKAPVESMMPLKLARYGVPLSETGAAGLAAAGIEAPATLTRASGAAPGLASPAGGRQRAELTAGAEREGGEEGQERRDGHAAATAPQRTEPQSTERHRTEPQQPQPYGEYAGERQEQYGDHSEYGEYAYEQRPRYGQFGEQGPEQEPARPRPRQHGTAQEPGPAQETGAAQEPDPSREYTYAAETQPSGPQVTVPVGPGRRRALGNSNAPAGSGPAYLPPQRAQEQQLFVEPAPAGGAAGEGYESVPERDPAPPAPYAAEDAEPVGIPDGVPRDEYYFLAYRQFVASQGSFPNARQLSRALHELHGVTNADGSLLGEAYLRSYIREFKERYNAEMGLAG